MTEEDTLFDPSLQKKKKSKKTKFDLDAALADTIETNDTPVVADDPAEIVKADDANDLDENLDLENFGKKKKKKKKPFNSEEPEGGAAATTNDVTEEAVLQDEAPEEGGNAEEDYNLDVDFSSKTKKKKRRKKDLEEILADKLAEDERDENNENVDENSSTWAGSDRDYTYDELLQRVFEIILDKNPDMAAGRKPKFVMRPPQVLRVGTKKTSFANFTEICKTLHRQPKHLLDFLLAELGTSGSVDGNSQLIIKGRFQPKQIENVLRRYIKEYVTCHTCRSPETILQKDTRLFFLQCETCGSRCSVASIKSGFQAVTSKRAAIRAKTA